MMSFAYLAVLLISTAGMLVLDRRFSLFFWRDPATALLVTTVGTALFLWWDIAGIAAGIFFQGESQVVSGVVLAPELPLEEPIFLVFLVLCTMVIFTGTMRLLEYAAKRPERSARAGGTQ